jgi:hypothetical protein
MMRIRSLAAAVLMLAAPALAWADPTGTFKVKGKNASDGSEYTGTVTVARTGETYSVTWKIGDSEYTGTGLGATFKNDRFEMAAASADDIAISVAYVSGKSFGMAMFFQQPDSTWQGVWAYGGSQKVAGETWTK